jgi:hypothetical protein
LSENLSGWDLGEGLLIISMTNERDDMRLQLARREAEVDALREMLGKK